MQLAAITVGATCRYCECNLPLLQVQLAVTAGATCCHCSCNLLLLQLQLAVTAGATCCHYSRCNLPLLCVQRAISATCCCYSGCNLGLLERSLPLSANDAASICFCWCRNSISSCSPACLTRQTAGPQVRALRPSVQLAAASDFPGSTCPLASASAAQCVVIGTIGAASFTHGDQGLQSKHAQGQQFTPQYSKVITCHVPLQHTSGFKTSV